MSATNESFSQASIGGVPTEGVNGDVMAWDFTNRTVNYYREMRDGRLPIEVTFEGKPAQVIADTVFKELEAEGDVTPERLGTEFQMGLMFLGVQVEGPVTVSKDPLVAEWKLFFPR